MKVARVLAMAALLLVPIALYLMFWPVPVAPVAWKAPPNPGYQGDFERNRKLTAMKRLPLAGLSGPEDLARDAQGRIYASTHQGPIVRLSPDGDNPEIWARTGGRPLGIAFSNDGTLYVGDAYQGLLAIAPDGTVEVVADSAAGVPMGFADDVAVADSGAVYFTDATEKFDAEAIGGNLRASKMDVLEHGANGRLLKYEPASGEVHEVRDGFHFANGVAMGPKGRSVLMTETASYRVLRIWVAGPREGEMRTITRALPGFPDNIETGREGRYWVGLVSPRNAMLDSLSDNPGVRKMLQRLPSAMSPGATRYGHLLAITVDGRITANLQDPDGDYAFVTGALETPEWLFVSSLREDALGRLAVEELGLGEDG